MKFRYNPFLHKLKQKIFLRESENDKFCRIGSAPTHIFRTPKRCKVSSTDSFPKLYPIVAFTGAFNYNLAC